MIRKQLGKIKKAYFGLGGYQDVMIGITFVFGGDSWGVGDFWGTWTSDNTRHSDMADSHINSLGHMCFSRIPELLRKAKVKSVEELVGVPVEVEFESGKLKSWRVLEEVL